MKNGKRPTRAQRDELKRLGYDPMAYLITKDCPQCLEIMNRKTKEVVRFELGTKGVTA